jgi:flagellar motor switch protein FliG
MARAGLTSTSAGSALAGTSAASAAAAASMALSAGGPEGGPHGLEDAAILLMSLGEEEAAEVFKHLAPKEVQRLGETITRLRSVTHERMAAVIDQFEATAAQEHLLVSDSSAYMKTVLNKALGADKAQWLLGRIEPGSPVQGIDSLKWVEPGVVAELLQREHPQVGAALLAQLEPDPAADVLKLLPEALRHDLLLRLATLERIEPGALQDLNEVISGLLAHSTATHHPARGGAGAVAAILNRLGGPLENAAMDYVQSADHELAQRIMDQLFTFDDVEHIHDKGIQALLKEVQTESLVLALKGASPSLRDKVFNNMSTRAAETLREDLDSRGPVRLAEVQAHQKELLRVIRRMVAEGQILLPGSGPERYVP